jgi:hypothetical protein
MSNYLLTFVHPFDGALHPVDVHGVTLALLVVRVVQTGRNFVRQLHLLLDSGVTGVVKAGRGEQFTCDNKYKININYEDRETIFGGSMRVWHLTSFLTDQS